MVRAPCCEKMGLKKGPWTAEEDEVLVSYIQTYGHGNWRALPKKAGLLRCGKSCRLRWINYLRPDIKRGNFTPEEEDAIICLHQQMGNKWSAIAAQLPGRTDNEIKNVWHTHLKKRVPEDQAAAVTAKPRKAKAGAGVPNLSGPVPVDASAFQPQPTSSSSGLSSWSRTDESTSSSYNSSDEFLMDFSSSVELPELDDSFWTEVLAMDVPEEQQPLEYAAQWDAAEASVSNSSGSTCVSVSSVSSCPTPPSPVRWAALASNDTRLDGEDDMDFWLRVLIDAGNMPEL